MSALAQLHRCHSPLTEKTLRCQVGNAQAGELFGALLAGFKVEDGTLVFECFGQSGFGDERGEPYPEAEDGDADVSGDTAEQTVEQKQATLSKKRENVTKREAAVAEATAELEVAISMACGQLEPEPEPSEGVPPS